MIKDTRQRLFEMMNRVGGMPLIKETTGNNLDGLTLPPGFSADDFLSNDEVEQIECGVGLDEVRKAKEKKPKAPAVYGSMKGTEPTPMEGTEVKFIPKDELRDKLKLKSDNVKAELPQGSSKEAGVDIGRIDTTTLKRMNLEDNKYIITLDQLAKMLQVVPTEEQLLGKNTKMGKSNFYNITLPALMALIYNQKNGEFYVLTTCPKAGECKKWCYAQMGNYIKSNPAVRLNMQKLNYLFNHYGEWKNRLIAEINRRKESGEVFTVRWHDAGDFISDKYLDIAIEVAKATPNVPHYAYTKMIDMVKAKGELPPNLLIRFSFGGEEDMPTDSTQGISRTSDYHADTVPKDVFKQYQPKRKNKFLDKDRTIPNPEYKKNQIWDISSGDMQKLKGDILAKYNFNPEEFNDRVLTHNEYMDILKDPNYKPNENPKRWIIVNKMGDTDIPANQPDVLGVYNLQHNEE
jgi:hypothetical protein